MEYSFKRASLLPAIYMICGLFLLSCSLIMVTIGSYTVMINFCLSILFIGQAIWHFSTPIIKISNGKFYHKKGILANEDMELGNVEKILFPNSSRIDLVFFNGHIEKIYLRNMAVNSREEFRELMIRILNSRSSRSSAQQTKSN